MALDKATCENGWCVQILQQPVVMHTTCTSKLEHDVLSLVERLSDIHKDQVSSKQSCPKIALTFSVFSEYPSLSVCCSMHMLPKSHDSGFYKHDTGTDFHIDYTMVDTPVPEDVSSRCFWLSSSTDTLL